MSYFSEKITSYPISHKKKTNQQNLLYQQLDILKKNFNNYSVTLSVFIANIVPRSSFNIYKSNIEQFAEQNSNKIIDTFILSVLKYEEQIMNGDEKFFLKKNYDEELNNENEYIMKVFEFKSVWKSLNEQNKFVVIQYMKLLCRIARKYFNLIYDNKIISTN